MDFITALSVDIKQMEKNFLKGACVSARQKPFETLGNPWGNGRATTSRHERKSQRITKEGTF
jgi:hypothetical protein